jgi:hypothetical protein
MSKPLHAAVHPATFAWLRRREALSMMPEPAWYAKVRRHPDYNDDRVILIDTNILSRLAVRHDWDDEMSFVMNVSPARLRLKINGQVHAETFGATGAGMNPARRQAQIAFIETYRATGKILIDDAPVPFFASSRRAAYDATLAAILATHNLSVGDAPLAADAIVNRLPLLTGDGRMLVGLRKVLANGGVRAVLKAHDLPSNFSDIALKG